MGLDERLQIAAEMKTPAATDNPSDTKKKPDAVAKKGSRKKKAPHSSESSSFKAESEKLQKKKDAIVIRARGPGRPRQVEAECKLTSMVEAILQRQVKEAPLMISKVTSFLMKATLQDEGTYAEALKAFYEYLDNVAYPSFHLCFASEGKVPNAELYRFISLKPEDYIYLVYKYVQDNEIDGQTMQKIRGFAQSKFKSMGQDFDISTVPVSEPARLATFYQNYALKIKDNKDQTGWVWSCLRGAVLHGHIKYFID